MSRANWGSKLGFVLATAGSAVGLGAIWKFPYMAGKNGGGAFLLVYLACVFTVGIGMLLAEMLIGRAAQKSATTAFRNLKGGLWPWAGRLSVLCSFVILSFYSVVGGWTFAYLYQSITGAAITSNIGELNTLFEQFIANPMLAVMYTAMFLGVTMWVVLRGVEKGIERWSKVLMPLLFTLMLLLIGRSLTLPGAMDGVSYFFTPNFSQINASMVLDAMGLAMFSLSVGCGLLIAYGSYVAPDTNLGKTSLWITLLATLACIFAGLLVLPAVFAFHVDPAAGPGLTFITMPAIFAQMPFGQLFAIAFFLLLIFAALTSSVSILEPIVAFLMDEFGLARKQATWTAGLSVFTFSIPAALSFGVLKDFLIAGKNPFDLMDYAASNLMLPAGGLLSALFIGWAIWPRITQDLRQEGSERILPVFRIVCAWVSPAVIGAIWWHSL
ncbi:sodium-dependent transporter [Chitinibacter bivalviorum]|uniref:Transporter n=1 Tax=Chitinibacter bivalviorum TaxID=2739434 RepID=A0A7H9BIA1_9NEIS|nr:sodium-dependent transporter [Chitinibacter bivalviorum]QLG88450.1 sodium-dependent transporter [Chitinibacter bivalviorum]